VLLVVLPVKSPIGCTARQKKSRARSAGCNALLRKRRIHLQLIGRIAIGLANFCEPMGPRHKPRVFNVDCGDRVGSEAPAAQEM